MTGKRRKHRYRNIICCMLEADRKVGSPLLKSAILIALSRSGIKLPEIIKVEVDKTPRRLITAKRVL